MEGEVSAAAEKADRAILGIVHGSDLNRADAALIASLIASPYLLRRQRQPLLDHARAARPRFVKSRRRQGCVRCTGLRLLMFCGPKADGDPPVSPRERIRP
jgi:hypothetical protein